MTIRKNLGLIIILASVGVTLLGFLFSTYDAKKSVLDNVMRSDVVVTYPDCKTPYAPGYGCKEFEPGTGLSIPYRWFVALGFIGILSGIYFSRASQQTS